MVPVLLMLAAAQQPSNPIDRDRLDRLTPPAPLVPQRVKGMTKIEAQGNQHPIRGIAFHGTEAPPEVARAAQVFLGRPNNGKTLAELVAALSDAYGKSRVAFFTIAVPRQDFTDDVVIVDLTEAGLEAVDVRGKGRFSRLRGLARPMIGKRPVPRALFERQIALMRAIPGLTFDLGVENPDNDEDLTLVLKARQKKVEGAIGINNRGPDLVGDMLIDGRLDVFGLAMDGDRLRLSASSSIKPKRYRQVGAAYDTPIGLSGLSASASIAKVRTSVRRYSLSGNATIAGLGLTYPLLRSFHRSADLALSLDGINSRNAAFGNLFSSDRTRTLRAGASYASVSERTTFQASLVGSQGLSILGARVDPRFSDKSFRKVNVTLAAERRFGQRFIVRGTALAQLTGDRLPAPELFATGGATVGRAFDTAFLTGDRGIGALGEFAARPIARSDLAKSEVYAFVDGATLRRLARPLIPGQSFTVASAGVGARARWRDKVELGVEGARVIDRPYPAYDQRWRLSFYYRLTM